MKSPNLGAVGPSLLPWPKILTHILTPREKRDRFLYRSALIVFKR